MNRIVHFEIHVDDPERAMKFYKEIFGWEYQDYSSVTGTPYWGVLTAAIDSKEPGINGGLLKRPMPLKEQCGSNAFVSTIQVENYDASAEKVIALGGKVAMPKFALAGMAWQGYFLDTEGNTFGLHQADTNAK